MALASVCGACGAHAPSPSPSPPVAEVGVSWQPLELRVAAGPLRLPMLPQSGRQERRVVLVLDDELETEAEVSAVIPPRWAQSFTVVVWSPSASRALAGPASASEDRITAAADEVVQVGARLVETFGGQRVYLVANGSMSILGARTLVGDALPWAGYVGAGQLTSVARAERWARHAPREDSPPEPGRSREGARGALGDELEREDLWTTVLRVSVPMILLHGAEDPQIPRHHLETWATMVVTERGTDVRSVPGAGPDLLRESPRAILEALWTLGRPDDAFDRLVVGRDCLLDDQAPVCRAPRVPWLGIGGGGDDASTVAARRFDVARGSLVPAPRVLDQSQRADRCSPTVDPGPLPDWEDSWRAAQDWFPGSYDDADLILQPRGLPQLFGAMKRSPETVAGALLVCRVKGHGGGSLVLPPTVAVQVTIGELERGALGMSGEWIYLSVPATHLSPGTPLSFRASRKKLIGGRGLGMLALTYEGVLPIRGEHDHVEAECRAMARPEILRRAGKPTRTLRASMVRYERAIERAERYPKEEHWRAWLDLEPLVARLGWADPCVEGWLDRMLAADMRWRERQESIVESARPSGPPLGEPMAVAEHARVVVTDAVCAPPRYGGQLRDRPRMDCRVDVVLHNDGPAPASVTTLLRGDTRASMTLANGEWVSLVPRDEPLTEIEQLLLSTNPWRRDERRTGDAAPWEPLGRRLVPPGRGIHVVYLGRISLRRFEVIDGFRPVTLRLAGPDRRLRLDPG